MDDEQPPVFSQESHEAAAGTRAEANEVGAQPCDAGISWIECLHEQAGKTTRQDRIDGATRSRGSPSPPTVQYTVRSVPAHVDKALRRKAQNGRKSLNEVLRDALIREAEGTDVPERVYTDLDALVGSWVDVPGFDDAIEAQDRVDEALWR